MRLRLHSSVLAGVLLLAPVALAAPAAGNEPTVGTKNTGTTDTSTDTTDGTTDTSTGTTGSGTTTSTPLRLFTYGRMLVDEENGRVFLSPGKAGSTVFVTDLSGQAVATLDGMGGATGMALSADGRSVWVALATAGALAQVDTVTLKEVRRVALPTGVCPGDVAVTGTTVVYGWSCNRWGNGGGSGGVGSFDSAAGTPTFGTLTSGPYYQPLVRTSPRAPGTVVAGDVGLSPTSLYVLDVRSGTPVVVTHRADTGSNLRDLAISPDGLEVVQAAGSPYQHDVFRLAKLEHARTVSSGDYPNAADWSNGVLAAGLDAAYEPDVWFHGPADLAPRAAELGPGRHLQPRGLDVNRDAIKAWAVSGDVYGGQLALHVLPTTAHTALLTLTGPLGVDSGTPVTVGGRLLGNDGAPLPGVTLSLSRQVTTSSGTSSASLGTVTTASDGSFSRTEVPTSGRVTYRASYGGDTTHWDAITQWSVDVRGAAQTQSSLALTAPTSPYVGKELTVGGTLTAGGTGVGGVTVELERGAASGTTTRTVTTAADGTLRVSDTPTTTEPVTWTARYAGDATRTGASASVVVTPQKNPTSLTLDATVSGNGNKRSVNLAAWLGPTYTNRTVTISAKPDGGTETAVVSGAVGTDGYLRTTVPLPKTTTTYTARFSGDAWYATATASRTVVR